MSRGKWLMLSGVLIVGLAIGVAFPIAGALPLAALLPDRKLLFAPLVLVGVGVALVQGVRSSHSNARLRRLLAGFGWAALFLLGVILPCQIHQELLWREIDRLPIPPGVETQPIGIGRQVDLDAHGGVSGFQVWYQTDLSIAEVEEFYRTRFIGDGWKDISADEFSPAAFASMPTIQRQRRIVFSRGLADRVIDFSEYSTANGVGRTVTVRGGYGLRKRYLW